ncbi:MAG: AMP-binding protein [Alphaproteobacteria bacterium]|nr:AMP-binding protein [Alphaproteobacteria bacterium]
MNLAAILLGHATARPNAPAIVGARDAIDYRACCEIVGSFAARLAGLGIGPGDRVGLALDDTADHLLFHYAVAWLGAAIVPIDHRWTVAEKAALARAFACKTVLFEPGDPACDQTGGIVVNPAWRSGDAVSPAMADDEDLPIMLSLSSGTTGRPTGALVSHRELYERWIAQWVGIGFNGMDRFLLATPLYFGAGRSFAMSFLAGGGTVIFAPPPVSAQDVIAAGNAHKVTAMFLVPTQLRGLLDSWQGAGCALPTVRRLVTSGAAIAAHERQRIIDRLTPGLVDYYASSEGGGISVLLPDEQLLYPETVGRPFFRVEVEIVDEQARPTPPGTMGRLRYRGPGVSRRLVNADGATETSRDAWYYPGDLALMLPSGHVRLAGRAKDLINRGGVNIYPAEIEAVLSTHPAIAELSVFGVADARLGEIVAAALVLRPGTLLAAGEVQAFGSERLAPYKVPAKIVFVAALPRNSSGKVIRSELAKLKG